MELSFGTFNLGPLFLLQKLTLIKLAHAVVDLYGVSRRYGTCLSSERNDDIEIV